MTIIVVVRKYPVIARIILPCTDDSARSCDVVDAVCVSLDLCQIITA